MARKADARNYRFNAAAGLLVLIALALSFYTNPGVTGFSIFPTAAATFTSADSKQVVRIDGLAGSSVLTPDGDGVLDSLALKFNPAFDCVGADGTHKGAVLTVTGKWSRTFTIGTPATVWDEMSMIGWPKGTYNWNLKCEEGVAQASSPVSGTFALSTTAYTAGAYSGVDCGTGKKCVGTDKCIDSTKGICERNMPFTPPLKGTTWLQYGGDASHTGTTTDVVYNPADKIKPGLKWSARIGDSLNANPPVVTEDTVYATSGKTMKAFWKDGSERWSFTLETSEFKGSPAFMAVKTPVLSKVAITKGADTITETGTESSGGSSTSTVLFGGQTHNAIISYISSGLLVAIDAETGVPVCDRNEDIGEQSCWGDTSTTETVLGQPLTGSRVGEMTGSPVEYGGHIYLAAKDGIKFVNDNGFLMTVYPAGKATMPTISNSKMYFGASDGKNFRVYKTNAYRYGFDKDQVDWTAGFNFSVKYTFNKDGTHNDVKLEKVLLDCGTLGSAAELAGTTKLCKWKPNINLVCQFNKADTGATTVDGMCLSWNIMKEKESGPVSAGTAAPVIVEGPIQGNTLESSLPGAVMFFSTNALIYKLDVGTLATYKDTTRPDNAQWKWPPTSIPLSNVGIAAPVMVAQTNKKNFFTMPVTTASSIMYVNQKSELIWTVETNVRQDVPMIVSMTGPIRTAYYVDGINRLNALEINDKGTKDAAGVYRPGDGEPTNPVVIYDFQNTPAFAISDNTLYVVADGSIYAFIADRNPPTYSNVRMLRGDEDAETLYLNEPGRLCADARDNYGITATTLMVTDPSGATTPTDISITKGKIMTVCADYTPTAKGDYTWQMQITDVGKNAVLTTAKSFTVIDRPIIDRTVPTIWNRGTDQIFLSLSGAYQGISPKNAINIKLGASDDIELKDVSVWVCVSDDKDGCELETGTLGPTAETDSWRKDVPLPSELKDKNQDGGWQAVYTKALTGPSSDLNILINPSNTKFAVNKGWPQNKYVFWTAYVCDKASQYPERDANGNIVKLIQDRCNVYKLGGIGGQLPKFFVADTEKPAIKDMKQSKLLVLPDGTDSVTLTADVSDNVGLGEVKMFILGNPTIVTPVKGKVSVTWKNQAPAELQGRAVEWFIRATDTSGNEVDSKKMSFKIVDKTAPTIGSAEPTYASVREGDMFKVRTLTFDNYNLKSVELLVDGQPCPSKAKSLAQANGRYASITLECAAPNIVAGKTGHQWSINVKDEAGNTVTGTTGTFETLPNCGVKSVAAPALANVAEGNATVLPGDTVLFSAAVSDEVDANTQCGGVERVWVETQGEDGIWQYAGEATLKNSQTVYSTFEKRNKITSANAEFNWTVPKYREWASLPFLITDISVLRVDSIRSWGAGGAGGPMLISTGVLATGGATTPAQATRPFGLAGTTVKWRFRAIDAISHEVNATARPIAIKDIETPTVVNATQDTNRLIYTNDTTVSACWKDNGQLSTIIFETDETGMLKNYTTDITSDNVWANKVVCKVHSISPVQADIGRMVHWRAFALDASTNPQTSTTQEFKVVSEPPVITSESTVPERPVQGQPVTIKVGTTDDFGLKDARFETNETGTFIEYAKQDLSGKTATAEFKWSNPAVLPGTAVFWRVKVTDIDGSETLTDPIMVVQEDKVAPTVTAPTQSSDNPPQGTKVLLNAVLRDNGALMQAILETDESGVLKNVSSQSVSGQSTTVTFEWQNKDVAAGKAVKWRIYAVDVAGNTGKGAQMTFTVTQAPKTCPVCPQAGPWSRCGTGGQTRTAYTCDESTDYKCSARTETQACTMSPADQAFEAIQKARTAVSDAATAGTDVTNAQNLLLEAEVAYANEDYTTALAKAEQAITLATSPPIASAPILGFGMLVLIMAIVAVFGEKKGLFKKLERTAKAKKAKEEEAEETEA